METDDEKTKRLHKEAIKEWLDEKFTEFGRWSFGAFCAVVVAALIYFVLWAHGWHK